LYGEAWKGGIRHAFVLGRDSQSPVRMETDRGAILDHSARIFTALIVGIKKS
jgi:hypothetical protein